MPDEFGHPTYEEVIASLGLTAAELAAKKVAPTLEQALWQSDRESRQQAWELMRAGWTFELPPSAAKGGDPQVGSWYWRRPGRRPGKPGRLFASTNQAYNAMKREQGA